jgi:protein-L-isoaspartate(D-aspartate) O-methyltransferase
MNPPGTDGARGPAHANNALAASMVRRQIEGRGIADARLLEAMRRIPRHRFVPSAGLEDAYGDFPLPIGHGQTISQPYIVAVMTEALALRGSERVLEVGTGSGYQTAVLAELAARVYSIERVPELAAAARKALLSLGYDNVRFAVGDGCEGWPARAPFDRILVAAAAPAVPPALAEQLADNGIMVIPIGDSRLSQDLVVVRRIGASLEQERSIGCRFVPLIGKGGFEG